MTITAFKKKIKTKSKTIDFQETIQLIESNYTFTPTTFVNGSIKNEAGNNSGSCKVFAFAKLEGLTKEETLACFGQYYTDVRNKPNGEDHQNIRNFIKTGFKGCLLYTSDAADE